LQILLPHQQQRGLIVTEDYFSGREQIVIVCFFRFRTYGKAQPDTIPGEGSVDFLRHVEAVESSVVPERPAVLVFYEDFGLRPVLVLLGRIEAFAIDAR
jgi:hypothetical protein